MPPPDAVNVAMRTNLETPKSYQAVMVSSTFTDLKDHRQQLIKAIEAVGYRANVMEHDSARADVDVINSSLNMVRDSVAYIGVISQKYGQTPSCPNRNRDRLSLTELEFNEAIRLRRPVLLFIMGENHPGKKSDFESSAGKQKKLEAFRERAKYMREGTEVERIYQLFQSLEEFTTAAPIAVGRLANYLDSKSYSALAHLIAAVSEAITAFTDKVELIADCKTIHDHLHELLQNVVRPLHDLVLPQWKQEGHMKPGTNKLFLNKLSRLSREEGALELLEGRTTKFKEDKSDLGQNVKIVLGNAHRLHPDHEPLLVREQFEEALDRFALAVNRAFSEADKRMGYEAMRLHYLHSELNEKVRDARPQQPLSQLEDDQLDSWLTAVNTKLKELDTALETHHGWQEIYAEMERVEAFRDQSKFHTRLASFCDLNINKLDQLVEKELEVIGGVPRYADSASAGDGTRSIDPRPNLLALRKALQRLRETGTRGRFRCDSQGFRQLVLLRRQADPCGSQ